MTERKPIAATKHSWLRSALGSIFSSTGIVLIGLATGVLVARVLGAEGRGLLAIAFTWTALITAMVQLPMSDVIVVSSTPSKLPTIIGAAFRLSVITVAVCLAPALWFLEARLGSTPGMPVWIALFYFLINVTAQVFSQVYRGAFQVQRRFDLIQLYSILQPALYLLFLLPMAFGWMSASVSTAIFALIASLVGTGIVRVLISGTPHFSKPEIGMLGLLGRAALPLHFAKMAQTLGAQGDRLLVVALAATGQVGIFFVALTFASVIPGLFSTAIRLLALPALVALDGADRALHAKRLVSISWLAGLLGLVTTAILAPVLLPLLFGPEFAPATTLAMLLAIPLALRSLRVTLAEVQKSFSASFSLSLPPIILFTVLAAISLALFPWLHIVGIVVARVVAEVVTVLFLSWRISRLTPQYTIVSWFVPTRADISFGMAVVAKAIRRHIRRLADVKK